MYVRSDAFVSCFFLRLMATNDFNPSAQVFTASSPDQALETWISATGRDNRGMTLVTAGKSGAGKSTLVKNLLRLGEEDRIPESKHSSSAITEDVEVYEHDVDGVQVRIVDMPGLNVPHKQEKKLIAELQKKTNGEADMLLYCASMAPCSKLDYIDRGIVKLLTESFKKQIWERTILVLTFGDFAKDEVKSDKDKAAARERGAGNNATEEDIEKGLERIVNDYVQGFQKILDSTVKSKKPQQLRVCPLDLEDIRSPRDRFQIAAIPTSKNQQQKILYGYSWDNYIYLEVLRKCNREAIPAFLKISRTTPQDIAIYFGGTVAAGGVGVGIGVGIGIGAAVGASAGMGVGAIPGAVIGGALGIFASIAAAIIVERFKD